MRSLVFIFILLGSEGAWAKTAEPCEGPLTAPTAKKTDPDAVEAARIWGLLEAFWAQKLGPRFKPTKLVFYHGTIQSGCGLIEAAKGPVYCGADGKTYLDFSFWKDLEHRFKSPGVGARVYALAHEYGHHIQSLLEVLFPTLKLRERAPAPDGLIVSQLNELWADALAGFFIREMHQTQRMSGDETIQAARCTSNIGDDQVYQSGEVGPECFRHGSSQQRQDWFLRGFRAKNATDTNPFILSPRIRELSAATQKRLEKIYLPIRNWRPF